ncbi:hypothetical protein IAQ61_005298 [Plenodomus lingam]|uniref:uncharacterized protein n=1 Tax=Leptosphaeria maculans TaxID=5022 RepID=UPI0033175BF8|nr:hypothetical protein IAQ61_005298 [Plenodomus lingam]
MVTTRRTIANAVAATTKSPTKPLVTQSANGTSRIVYTNIKTFESLTPTPEPSTSTSSQHSFSTPSTPPACSTLNLVMTTTNNEFQNQVQHDPGPLPVRQVLAPKPHGMAGSVNNPISMLEDSPSEKSSQAPNETKSTKRKHQQQQKIEPHKFVDNGHRKLHSHQQFKPAVVPQPAQGTIFTGHQSQDIYRAINARVAAATETQLGGVPAPAKRAVPYEVQFPMSARFLANRVVTNPTFASFMQQHGVQVPTAIQLPAQSEVFLRRKAIHSSESEEPIVDGGARKTLTSSMSQMKLNPSTLGINVLPTPNLASTTQHASIINSIMPTPTQRYHATPGSTNTSAPTSATQPLFAHKKGKIPVFRDSSQNPAISQHLIAPASSTIPIELTHLIDNTILITSLLQIYSKSRDQRGLRQDLSMLVSVQNQRFAAWQKSEADAARKQRAMRKKDVNAKKSAVVAPPTAQDAARAALREIWQGGGQSQTVEQAEPTKTTMDSQMRDLLSAGAGMWQDGSGVGVADVFTNKTEDGCGEEAVPSAEEEEEEEEEEEPEASADDEEAQGQNPPGGRGRSKKAHTPSSDTNMQDAPPTDVVSDSVN